MSQFILLREKQADRDREIEDAPDEKTSLDQHEFLRRSGAVGYFENYIKENVSSIEKRRNVQLNIVTSDPSYNTEGDWLSREDNRVVGLDHY